jgi:hypothetical protein
VKAAAALAMVAVVDMIGGKMKVFVGGELGDWRRLEVVWKTADRYCLSRRYIPCMAWLSPVDVDDDM